MTEKHIILEDVDLVIFYGVNNVNMQMLKALYPKLRIVARGDIIKVLGEEEQLAEFEANIRKLQSHASKYNQLTEEDLLHIVKGEKTKRDGTERVIVYSVQGKPITARTANQQRLVEAYNTNDMVFATGPAGSGKTYTAIALAVRALKNKEIRKIILSRPAVEAGEKLGFLPGDMKDKIDPYLQPLYDALEDMIPSLKLQEMMQQNIIQIAPLAFMRGRTLNDAVVILDEAQNTTSAQIKMFLTRMGMNTKMIITGDFTQIDLPPHTKSGLIEALSILNGVKGIAFVEMNKGDIVRHKLVTRIVEAYEKADKEKTIHHNPNFNSIKSNEETTPSDGRHASQRGELGSNTAADEYERQP
ncbi:MAG: PhoH family protein [Bacteroidales bacterium]|nr:PhoH family protein [Candidatus Physcousia equi]